MKHCLAYLFSSEVQRDGVYSRTLGAGGDIRYGNEVKRPFKNKYRPLQRSGQHYGLRVRVRIT